MEQKPLELSTTVAPEQQITIDGEPYNLRTRPETAETLRNRDLGEEIKELIELRGDERTAEHDARIVEINNTLVNSWVDAPPEILAKLPDEERAKLINYVTDEIKKRAAPLETGGESSPDSTDSTE